MKLWKALHKNLIASVLFLSPASICLLITLVPALHVAEPIEHLLLTLTAVMGVHLLDRIVLFREIINSLSETTSGLQEAVRSQTEMLADKSASLQAMIASDIERVYSSREEAAGDIHRDLTNSENEKIRIIGISLNDFVRAETTTLNKAWLAIRHAIKNRSKRIDVKILLIDPECLGAQMRSKGEAQIQSAVAGRLGEDVIAVAESLLALEKEVNDSSPSPKETGTSTTFECRFYRLAPTLFLCQADSVCYVQQYYYWSHRNQSHSCPVVRYRKPNGDDGRSQIYDGMTNHFDWIWKHASISIAEVLDAKSIGIDRGLHQCRATNFFASESDGRERIQWLLESDPKIVWIQGISLSSFFRPGRLFNAIVNLIEKDIDLRVLLIDIESEQAKYRSYREYLFAGSEYSLKDYLDSEKHQQSDLHSDTDRSITNIQAQVSSIRNKKGKNWEPKILVRRYKTAPACFMLRVDDKVLVEQYHYGKVFPKGQGEAPAILGKDMPLVEYRESGEGLYDEIKLRSPFALLNDHFEFAFKYARDVPLLPVVSNEITTDSE